MSRGSGGNREDGGGGVPRSEVDRILRWLEAELGVLDMELKRLWIGKGSNGRCVAAALMKDGDSYVVSRIVESVLFGPISYDVINQERQPATGEIIEAVCVHDRALWTQDYKMQEVNLGEDKE